MAGARHTPEARRLPIGTPACISRVAAEWRRLRSALAKAIWMEQERKLFGNVSYRQGGGNVFPKLLKVLALHTKLKYPGIDRVYGPFYDTEDRRF